MKYIIEHLESRLYKWSILEYQNISSIVGKRNLIFTNTSSNKLKKFGKVIKKSLKELNLDNVCVLDPFAKRKLKPEDKDKFDYLVFGGILGTNPASGRTKKELGNKRFERRNLGKKQMPTDNAVYVAKKIIEGTPIEKIKFKDGIELELKEGESIFLPFRYVIVNGKPLVPKNLITHLNKKSF